MRIAVLLLSFSLLIPASPGFAQGTECAVSYSQYARLTKGMTYGQVMRVLGCAGLEMNTVEGPGTVTITFYWTGRGDPGASLSVVIRNNVLVSVFPVGLRD